MSFAILIYCNNDSPSLPSHRKKFLVSARNFFPEEEIFCQRKKFIVGRKIFLTEEEISFQSKKIYQRKKFLVKGKNFLSLEAIYCQKTIILVKFSVIERNVLSKEDFYSQMKKFIVIGKIYSYRKKFIV